MQEKTLATGAVLGALAASSCCVLPLVLVSAGVGGAWIGTLTVLAPYQPIFLVLSGVCIAGGFWSVYRRPQAACDGSTCGTPASGRLTKTALWAGTLILAAVVTVGWWARLLT